MCINEGQTRIGEGKTRIGEGQTRIGEGKTRIGEGKMRIGKGQMRIDEERDLRGQSYRIVSFPQMIRYQVTWVFLTSHFHGELVRRLSR